MNRIWWLVGYKDQGGVEDKLSTENLAEHPMEFSKDYSGRVTQLKIRISESFSLLVVIEAYGNGWLG